MNKDIKVQFIGYDKLLAAKICNKIAPNMFPEVKRIADNSDKAAIIEECQKHPGTVYYSYRVAEASNNTNEAHIYYNR